MIRSDLKKLVQGIRKIGGKYPEKYVGGFLINVFGLQIARIFWFNLLYFLKPRIVKEETRKYLEILAKDGIIVLPEFISESLFGEIKTITGKLIPGLQFKSTASQGLEFLVKNPAQSRVVLGRLMESGGTPESKNLFKLLDQAVKENPILREIVSGAIRGNYFQFTPWEIFFHKKLDDGYPELDVASYFHSDTFHPEFKVFLYLSDNDEKNGSFVYVPGSHRPTFERIKFEYYKSISYAKLKAENLDKRIKAWPDGRGWHCLTAEEESVLKLNPRSINGRAGTLVIFNTAGFHRRGDFSSDKLRAVASFAIR